MGNFISTTHIQKNGLNSIDYYPCGYKIDVYEKASDHRLEIIPVELSGRAKRVADSLVNTVDAAVNDLSERIRK